jgi:serine/threonine-protein kinase RsbW
VTDEHAVQESVADEVVLTLPPRPEYARIARLAVTGLAARMRFSYDDVEDLRVGVGEMCNILLETTGSSLVVRCSLGPDEIRISATRVSLSGELDITDLSRQILDAFLSDVEVHAAEGRIDATKRRSIEP